MATRSEKSREWNLNNKDRYLANKRKSHHKNKARYNARRNNLYHSPAGVFQSLRSLAPQRKTVMLMTKEEFIAWYSVIERKCFYCDIPEELANSNPIFGRGHFQRLTIDKLDPHGAYAIKNVVLACYLCNCIKGNALTPTEMKEIAQKYLKPKWQPLP